MIHTFAHPAYRSTDRTLWCVVEPTCGRRRKGERKTLISSTFSEAREKQVWSGRIGIATRRR
jgi:hypothetical protein